MAGPFLAGQRLTAGQLNDATQKTLTSVEVGVAGALATGIGATEVNIPKLALGPVALVAGGLYHFDARVTLQQTVATDGFMMRLRRDTALTGTVVAEWLIYAVAATSGNVFFAWDDFISTIAEPTVNYFVSFKRDAR